MTTKLFTHASRSRRLVRYVDRDGKIKTQNLSEAVTEVMNYCSVGKPEAYRRLQKHAMDAEYLWAKVNVNRANENRRRHAKRLAVGAAIAAEIDARKREILRGDR